MIGDGWDETPAIRPDTAPGEVSPARIAVITGTRAEFGLLVPVMRAIEAHPALQLQVIAAGSHLISPALTFREVKAAFPIADTIPMQVAGRTGRAADVQALAAGIARFGRSFEALQPHCIVVLGDRIEAFAAASAAAIGGIPIAHIHGGDRAEGIADESMRHAITKLAHLHFAATSVSADRIIRMGERADRVFNTGSPAADGLATIPKLSDSRFADLGSPRIVILHHPVGRHAEAEEAAATLIIDECSAAVGRDRLLILSPNHDPGRDGILRAITESTRSSPPARHLEHLPRADFLGLLKRLARTGGLLVGNSSAGLIEAAILGTRVVNIGPRQHGRERAANVRDADESAPSISAALRAALAEPHPLNAPHPYGDGHTGAAIALTLATLNLPHTNLGRKLNTY
ncbi:MAG: UDP-N-acetylglucosamine 2-epimerase (hydrolyzing) [Planctomycetes bacterium]|nr:UDP-N-acetylglucosamine 2-epimerase (hydrolyzing) [Planctomycetota bacterium]